MRYTEQQIRAMGPGPEMDRVIWQEALGHTPPPTVPMGMGDYAYREELPEEAYWSAVGVPRYSTDPASALSLIESSWSLERFYWSEDWVIRRADWYEPRYQVLQWPQYAAGEGGVLADEGSLPLAICRTVLWAVLVVGRGVR
jgi:hypothetical protein